MAVMTLPTNMRVDLANPWARRLAVASLAFVALGCDAPEDENPAPARGLELKIWGGAVDPTAAGNTRFGAGDSMQEAVKSAGILEYDPAQTYEFEIAWDDAEQTLFMARDGEVLLDFQTGDLIPGPDNDPILMRYRYIHLAMPYLGNSAFWPIIDGVYGSVAIGATPASGGPPPGEDTTTGDDGDEITGTAGSEGTGDGEGSSEVASETSEGPQGDESGTSESGTSEDGTGTLPLPPGLDDRTPDVGCACTSATSSRRPASAFAVWLSALLLGLRRTPSGSRRARGRRRAMATRRADSPRAAARPVRLAPPRSQVRFRVHGSSRHARRTASRRVRSVARRPAATLVHWASRGPTMLACRHRTRDRARA
jgi:hypothetical protein